MSRLFVFGTPLAAGPDARDLSQASGRPISLALALQEWVAVQRLLISDRLSRREHLLLALAVFIEGDLGVRRHSTVQVAVSELLQGLARDLRSLLGALGRVGALLVE